MSRVARLVVVALASATPVLPVHWVAAPASAATCAAGGGVSVVVDFNSLGGGVSTSCVPGGGGDKASAIVTAAGHELTRAQRQPGFVCRVDSVPADDPCVNASPADAFWSLWWSNGTSGKWTYSSQGVDSLTIPDGGSVALSWDEEDGSNPPSATPPKASAPSPSPSSESGSGGSEGSGPGGSTGAGGSGGLGGSSSSAPDGGGTPTSGSSTTTATPDAGPASPRERRRGGREGGKEQRQDREQSDLSTSTPGPTDDASPTTEGEVSADPAPAAADPAAADRDSGGLPVWVAPLALLVLALGAGATVLVRRRSDP